MPILISNASQDAGEHSRRRRRTDKKRSLPTRRLNKKRKTDKAVLWCDVLGKTNDCYVVTSGLGCLALAESSDGRTLAGRIAPTQDAADAAALDGAGPGSVIDLHDCNSWL
jgi:hypothetical protein